jgi:hypothetical protein
MLIRQRSTTSEVNEVADTGQLGVELDLQIGQMTLRSKHLAALETDVAGFPDVKRIFGDSTMQASLLERAENRKRFRLVGLRHELEHWHTEHQQCPPMADEWERDYDPAELCDTEQWLVSLFEPVRKSFFNGPQPPPMTFMMPDQALPAEAEVAVLLGVHQKLGGPFKLVYLFRRFRTVHVYECVSQGRQWWYSLHLTTDTRYCLREMQPSTDARKQPYPDWWKRGAGDPYPAGLGESLCNHIDKDGSHWKHSVMIVRDAEHESNLSGGKEVLVPSRLLYGLLPQTLLDQYTFWQDERTSPAGSHVSAIERAMACGGAGDADGATTAGYKHLRGYPNAKGAPGGDNSGKSKSKKSKKGKADDDDDDEAEADEGDFMLFVEFQCVGSWTDPSIAGGAGEDGIKVSGAKVEITALPGRTVRVVRRDKEEVLKAFKMKQRVAGLLESLRLMKPPEDKKKKKKDDEEEDKEEDDKGLKFAVGAKVEMDYEGNGEFWPADVAR